MTMKTLWKEYIAARLKIDERYARLSETAPASSLDTLDDQYLQALAELREKYAERREGR